MNESTLDQRFWSKVDKTEDCWLWTGYSSRGYGAFWFQGTPVKAHRLAYEISVGPIPPGMTIDHLCHTKNCVRPSHLECVTHGENTQRAHRDGLVPRRNAGRRGPHGSAEIFHIREAMASAGVTQTALAERLGLTQPAVSARLSGRTPITVGELQIIASVLGVEPADLLGCAA